MRGLEPRTPASRTRCAAKLRYIPSPLPHLVSGRGSGNFAAAVPPVPALRSPDYVRHDRLVENPGVEPGTSAMRQQRSSRHELIPLGRHRENVLPAEAGRLGLAAAASSPREFAGLGLAILHPGTEPAIARQARRISGDVTCPGLMAAWLLGAARLAPGRLTFPLQRDRPRLPGGDAGKCRRCRPAPGCS